MKGARPEQAALTRDTDMRRTEDTRATIEAMVDGLNDHRIDDIGAFFADGFRWMGNRGCGTKHGLREFQDNWQRPFQAAFADKVCIDEARLYMGEWAAAFGRQEATHAGPFMGIAPTGKRVTIRYMDFWKVVDGRITDNWVMVDFPDVLSQLGVDVFGGEGWEAFDRGTRVPPRPGAPMPPQGDERGFAVKGLGEVAIRVGAMAPMVRFYRDILGLPLMAGGEDADITFFRIGPGHAGHTTVLALFTPDAGRAEIHPQGRHAPVTGAGSSLHHIALNVDFAAQDAVMAWYDRQGLDYNVQTFGWVGWRGIFARDPEGNTVELVAHDASLLDAAGQDI